jgi:hypothetical protein
LVREDNTDQQVTESANVKDGSDTSEKDKEQGSSEEPDSPRTRQVVLAIEVIPALP